MVISFCPPPASHDPHVYCTLNDHNHYCTNILLQPAGTAIPAQIWTGPQFSSSLRLTNLNTIGNRIWYDCQLYSPTAFTSQKIFLVLICDRLATGWTVRGSNPGGGEIFRTRPDRPWDPPSLLYNGHRVFPGGKAAGAWC
jgi:hypothetical protein